jgi:hypothetical protein
MRHTLTLILFFTLMGVGVFLLTAAQSSMSGGGATYTGVLPIVVTGTAISCPTCGTSTGTVTGVSGTANQIDVTNSTTNPVVSLDAAITLPGTLNNYTFTAPATAATLAIANNKTFTVSNSLTLAGTDATTMTFPGTSDTVVTLAATQTLTNKTLGVGSISGLGTGVATFLATPSSANLLSAMTTKTGTNNLVFSTAPTFDSTITVGTVGGTTGTATYVGTTSGTATAGCVGATCTAFGGSGQKAAFGAYTTGTNCSSSASPAVCTSAAAGSVALPTGTNPTLQVNTSAVTANSQIILTVDESLGTKLSVTCNTTLSTLLNPVVTARNPATSFTFTIGAIIATNPACVSYTITN